MAAAPPETNGKTRGEAIIKRRDGSLEIQIVKVGVLQFDTCLYVTVRQCRTYQWSAR